MKFEVVDFESLKSVRAGIVERIGLMNSFIKIGDDKEINEVENHEQAFRLMMSKLEDLKKEIFVVGHRVVHGGEEFTEPIIIGRRVFHRLKKYNKLAPLHNPITLSCVNYSDKYFKKAEDVAVFDTAFYKTLPDYAYMYALPMKFYKRHKIRKYGFHGISHQYVANAAAKKMRKPLNKLNLITCHLGSGCSVTAIKKGQAIDTSMGFTPLEGLVMSTRSGSIDPAIPLFMIRKLKMTENEVSGLLNKRSGLFGLSGSMDMREILYKAGYNVPGFKMKGRVKKKDQEIAKLTIEIFIYNIKKYIGAYNAILGEVDALIFTAGIGERSSIIRKMITKDFPDIKDLVIPTNEELMIAQEIKKIIK